MTGSGSAATGGRRGGIILSAPASGSGKTTIVLALLRHLRRGGVASAKVGPDYIDPAFHAAASGTACLNLDCWAMRPSTLDGLISALERTGHLVLCEGAMGLFDGVERLQEAGRIESETAESTPEAGSTADLAERTGWPIVMVVDVRGQAASAAALLRGFDGHRPGLPLAGVIFNRVGGPRHQALLRAAMAAHLPELPILGMVPRDPALTLPERHLGLVQAAEHPDLDGFLDRAAAIVAAHVDLGSLLALARPAWVTPAEPAPLVPPLGQRIAVACDTAFAFVYPAMLAAWRRAGAELQLFSPLSGDRPAADADAVYLPGGYPELHAGRLAAATGFLNGLRAAAARGATVYGECGGYMVLGRGLVDGEGERHEMAGLLPVETSFARRRLHLGYRRAVALPGPFAGPFAAGTAFRGHEFHYASTVSEGPGQPLFALADAAGATLGTAGRVERSVAGSFVHLIDLL